MRLHLLCSDGIVRWVKKKTGPAAADMADKAALTAAEKEAEVIVLGYFTEKKVSRGPGGMLLRGQGEGCYWLRRKVGVVFAVQAVS
jgi:hypothetical protein